MKPRPWLPYVLPMGLYMVLLAAQSNANLVWLYPVKIIVVATALWWFRRRYTELHIEMSWLAVAIGSLAIAIWIIGDAYYPKLSELMFSAESILSNWLQTPPPGPLPAPFDPTSVEPSASRYLFFVFRLFGAVVVVPVMEELFWRAFLIRWVDAEDFQRVPIGRYSWKAFAITTILFALEHDQWLAGLVCGALYNWLLYRSRSVTACIIAHATSNALLAAWVLATGNWKYW